MKVYCSLKGFYITKIMDVLKVWDNFSPSENVQEPSSEVTCDHCHTYAKKPFYSLGNGSYNVDLCSTCFDTPNIIDKFFKLEIIDRLDKTEQTNPRRWPCFNCKLLLGGGYRWYTLKHQHPKDSFRDDTILDFCETCWQSTNLKENQLQPLKTLFTPVKEHCQIVTTRSGATNLIDFRDCRSELTFLDLPESITTQMTQERLKNWISGLELFSITDTLKGIPFGSVMQWVPFTDDCEIPFHSTKTALMVDCHKDTFGRIASVSINCHGETNVNVIFNNLTEYERELKEWSTSRLSPDSDEFKLLYTKVKKDFHDGGSNDDEHAKICDSFSSYIRIKKHLPLDDY